MNFSNIVKILGVIAAIATSVAGFLGTINPNWAAIATGVAAVIFAFLKAIGSNPAPEVPSIDPNR